MKKKQLNWKPVRRGKFYCSSACGGQCLHADYVKRKTTAQIAREMMREPTDWQVVVCENLGWFVTLRHKPTEGRVSVHISFPAIGSPYFYCMFSLHTPGAGDTRWTDNETFYHPQKAVDHTLQFARQILQHENTIAQKALQILP